MIRVRLTNFKTLVMAGGLLLAMALLGSTRASAALLCRDVNRPRPNERAAAAEIKKEFPDVYNGIERALGEDETIELVKDWHRDDLAPTEKKFDDFRRHIIEHLRDPNQTKDLPRQYVLEIFGNLGEVVALSEFRRTQPAGVEIVGDISRGNPASGGLRRPDGLSFNVDPVTGHLRVHALLESKISKTSSAGFKLAQYQEMFEQWKTLGVQLNERSFAPEQIDLTVSDRVTPLREATLEDFLDSLYLYQPSAHNLTPEQRAQAGIRHLMPVLVDPWKMRFLGISVTNEAMSLYLRDEFPDYLRDMHDVIAFYRQPRTESEIIVSAEWREKILPILARYDVEYLNAALATLAPDVLQEATKDQTVHASGLIEIQPKKSSQAALTDYTEWRAGRLQIDDPVQLMQLRLRYDALSLCGDFLLAQGRWPQKVHLDPRRLTPDQKAQAILEDRLQSVVASGGGESVYFLSILPRGVA